LAEHLVRDLLMRRHAVILRIGSESRLAYNARLYQSVLSRVPGPGTVCIDPVFNLIELRRVGGEVDAAASFHSLVDNYGKPRQRYLERLPDDVSLVIDIGVPPLAAAAKQRNIKHFTVFDHAWSVTYRELLGEYLQRPGQHRDRLPIQKLENCLAALEYDESLAQGVFLFRPPITPAVFRNRWRELCPGRVHDIPRAFGGPVGAEREAYRESAALMLGRQRGATLPAVLVSAGGTDVWNELLGRLIEELVDDDAEQGLPFHALIFAPAPVRERLASVGRPLGDPIRRPDGKGRSVDRYPLAPHVDVLGDARNVSFSRLVSGVEWVVTRAGGATVNDALAAAIPLVLVPEPAHWQVRAIHRSVLESGFGVRIVCESVPDREAFEGFRRAPAATLRAALQANAHAREAVRSKMMDYGGGGQKEVVDEMVRTIEASSGR
jgi:hypothetical protein